MPRNVRNFWIAASVDGREMPIGTGPKTKTGGFLMNIYQRENSRISDKHVRIYAHVGDIPGKIVLDIDWIGVDGCVLEQFAHIETFRD